MKIVTAFPNEVVAIENAWITMPDGTRLAARIWLPRTAESEPVPAILEYIPYRKRDWTAKRDSVNHPYFAGHGYAAVRVDLRGSGDSEGVLKDEYLDQELDDGERVLEWIAEQPWCNGSVGMMGISWGGFNALQIAARRPPQLKAIIAVCASDDRYRDDVHYMGGCLLVDNLSWAATMFAYTASPPDPAIVGDNWREMWFNRMENSGLWLEQWLKHQHRDAYWKHGSVCEDYASIQCPVLAVSGWADGYTNAVFRLLEHLKVPRMGLVGPWSHKYPHESEPGPTINFLGECVRWWDRWLKDMPRALKGQPTLQVWMQEPVPPFTAYRTRPGRWVGEEQWPAPSVHERRYLLAPQGLLDASHPELEAVDTPMHVNSPLSVGLFAGKWLSVSADSPDLPGEQREDDGGALVFESFPLEERFEMLGAPIVELEVASDKPVAMVAVRLSDVGPDLKATRVTYGLLNLTHRESSEHPKPLEPGTRYPVRIILNDIAHAFPKGHRLRLSISTSYWPLAWPAPEPATLTLFTGNCSLLIPVRPPRQADDQLPEFGEAEGAPPQKITRRRKGEYEWNVNRNLKTDQSRLEIVEDRGVMRLDEIDWEVASSTKEMYTFCRDDFGSLRGEARWVRSFSRPSDSGAGPAVDLRTVARVVLTSNKSHLHIAADLDAFESDQRAYCRSWSCRIPRDNL